MSTAPFESERPPAVTPDTLRLALEADGGRNIQSVGHRPSPYRSTARLDEVEVRYAGGRSVQLMFKESVLRIPEAGGRSVTTRGDLPDPRPRFLRDAVREASVYRSVLRPEGATSPTLHAAVTGPEDAWSWLLMERVRGRELWQCGEIEAWLDVAEWLARHHARYAGPGGLPGRVARLLPLDDAHHQRWLKRALEFGQRSGDPRRIAVTEAIAAAHPRVLGLLAEQPRTFLHGELFPSNVMIRADPMIGWTRACPLDWESASIGPCLMDLAALTSGRWAPERRARVERRYREVSSRLGGWAPADDLFAATMRACRLQLTLQLHGWAEAWTPPRQHAHDWLTEAEGLMKELRP